MSRRRIDPDSVLFPFFPFPCFPPPPFFHQMTAKIENLSFELVITGIVCVSLSLFSKSSSHCFGKEPHFWCRCTPNSAITLVVQSWFANA